MAEQFNAYYEWLGIPPEVERPDHYQLLGIRAFEDNPRVIENAADRQMSHLRTFQTGPHAADSQRILNEVAAAKLCLLRPEKRTVYDAQLRARQEARKPAPQAASQTPSPNTPVQPAPFQRVVSTPVNPVQVVRAVPTQPSESFVPDMTGGEYGSKRNDRSGAARGEVGQNRADRGKKPGVQALAIYGLIVLVSGTVGLAGIVWMRTHWSEPQVAEADPAAANSTVEAKQSAGTKQSDPEKSAGRKAPGKPASEADSDAVATILSAAAGEKAKPARAALPAAQSPQPGAVVMAPAAVPAARDAATPLVAGAPLVAGTPVNLLALIDPVRDAVRGQWTMTGGVLNSPATEYPILEIPYAPPADYTLQVVGEREAGEGLTLGLIIAGKQAHAVFDANQRTLSGIGNIDGKGPSGNPTGKQINDVLGDRQRYTVVCAVRGCGVEVSVNGQSIAKWSGTPEQLSLAWGGGPHKDRLFIQQHQGVHHISEITLVPYALAGATPAKAPPSEPAVAKNDPAMPTGESTIQLAPGSVVFLSELNVLDSASLANLKHAVGSKGVPSPHGIFLHPPGKPGFMAFQIGGGFTRFDGQVSLNDSVPYADGVLTFSVLGDGKELWRSKPIKTSADEQAFSIGVEGVNRLDLVVTHEGSLGRAHGAWIEPRLIAKGGPAPAKASITQPAIAKNAPATDEPTIQLAPGSVVFLSDLNVLDFAKYANLKHEVGSKGVPSPHGIFLHPPGNRPAFMAFKIGGGFTRFDGQVSLNDSVPNAEGMITFSVIGDGRELWRSKPVKTSADEQAFSIGVEGVDRLDLVVTHQVSIRRAHGAWIEPRLVAKGGPAPAMASASVPPLVPAGVVPAAIEPITTFNDPAFIRWVRRVAGLPAEEQVKLVAEKLQDLNPGFETSKFKPRIENGVVTFLLIDDKHVRDLSPLRALQGLTQLIYVNGKSLRDLSPLKGMSLTSLDCGLAHVSDLTPLRGMPLAFLNVGESKTVSDLSPLRGMKLTVLNINASAVSDLTPLKGMPLADLTCAGSQMISDLSPLATCKNLKRINVHRTRVTAASVAALQKARPQCKIEWDGAGK